FEAQFVGLHPGGEENVGGAPGLLGWTAVVLCHVQSPPRPACWVNIRNNALPSSRTDCSVSCSASWRAVASGPPVPPFSPLPSSPFRGGFSPVSPSWSEACSCPCSVTGSAVSAVAGTALSAVSPAPFPTSRAPSPASFTAPPASSPTLCRSEERRVGKECRARRAPKH